MKLKKYLARGLILGITITNIPLYSFANNIENQYYNELSSIETKEGLQKLNEKILSEGEIDTWITGLPSMPTQRGRISSVELDKKIYIIGGTASGFKKNTMECYNTVTKKWETKTNMHYEREYTTATVCDGKIYVFGGLSTTSPRFTVKAECYDPETNNWTVLPDMPTGRYRPASCSYNGKIYVTGGWKESPVYEDLDVVEVYDTATNTWESLDPMPCEKQAHSAFVIDDKMYIIGGYGSGYSNVGTTAMLYNFKSGLWETLASSTYSNEGVCGAVIDKKIYMMSSPNIQVYDTESQTWEVKSKIPSSCSYGGAVSVNEKVYAFNGGTSMAYIAVEKTLEQEADYAVSIAEVSKSIEDITIARELVNNLSEGEFKNLLQNRLNLVIPRITLNELNGSSTIDTYIKSENMLSVTLDTNSVVFEDFSGIEDMIKINAINVTVSSSLPYQLNAYLTTEIQNSDSTKIMDKSIFNIKENSESEYKTFTNLNEKMILKDNCISGYDIFHGIDIKLKQGIPHEKNVYKTTIKLEVEQK